MKSFTWILCRFIAYYQSQILIFWYCHLKKHCGVCEVLEVGQILVMLGMCSTGELHTQSLQCPWLKMRVRAVDGIPWAPLLFITHLCGPRPRFARVCRTSTAPAVSWGSQTGNSSAIAWPLPDRRSEQALLRMVVSVALFTGMSLQFRLGGSVSWVFSEGVGHLRWECGLFQVDMARG